MARIDWHPENITAEIEKKAMDRLEKAAGYVQLQAILKCPVGIDVPKGKGKWSGRKAGDLRRTIRVVRLHGDPKLNVRIYAGNKEVYYAHFVEHGTVNMPAKPFLRPAFHAAKGNIMNIMENG
jgi:HK97 gp10 family phage protein